MPRRYLTFCVFTLQVAQAGLALLQDMGAVPFLDGFVDAFSCAVMPLANVVTVMYFLVDRLTVGAVEGGKELRPWWLEFAVHQGNTIYAWLDVLASERRSFPALSRTLLLAIALSYAAWINTIKALTREFPYPFLNALPQPYGIAGTIGVSLALSFFFWHLGRTIRHFKAKETNKTL